MPGLVKSPQRVLQETPVSCFRACVASLLGLAWSDVPAACDGDVWDWNAFQDWLFTQHGLQAIEILLEACPRLYPVRADVYCILTGNSPRPTCITGKHAVVAALTADMDFRLLHDPHRSGDWIRGEPTCVTFLVPAAQP